MANGTVINALAQDAAGNNSSPTSATVDSLAPAAPVIDPSNGSVIAGTAEAGATVILTDGNGNPIGQVTADGSGNWSFTPGTPLSNGTVVNAVAQDAAGNTSGPASTTVDSVAPAAPVIDPSNGSVIAGTAEAGATVILTDGGGNPIGQATAVLKLERVGMADNFFELGGHSLLATQVTARIHAELDMNAPLVLLFQAETLQAYATSLEGYKPTDAADFDELREFMSELEAV